MLSQYSISAGGNSISGRVKLKILMLRTFFFHIPQFPLSPHIPGVVPVIGHLSYCLCACVHVVFN